MSFFLRYSSVSLAQPRRDSNELTLFTLRLNTSRFGIDCRMLMSFKLFPHKLRLRISSKRLHFVRANTIS